MWLFDRAINRQPPELAIDFAGFDLTRVEVMTTAYQQSSPESFEITLQFTVYGDRIPEPGTLAMCSLFGMLAVCRRR